MKRFSKIDYRFLIRVAKCKVKITLLLLPLLTFTQAIFAQAPVINALTPNNGPIGTVVSITGSNFSSVAAHNFVSFGGVRASVSTASASSLTVTVPKFGSGAPVTVTNLDNGLTAYALKPFMLTFPGADNIFTSNSFADPQIFITAIYSVYVAIGDLDEDGRPDLAVTGSGGGSGGYLSILRNTSTGGSISFADSLDFPNLVNSAATGLQIADMDGDGKPDLVTLSNAGLAVSKNTSTAGHITLAAPVLFSSGPGGSSRLEVNDLDGDGKPDIVLMNNGVVSILKNTGTTNSISFDNPVSFPSGTSMASDLEALKIADMDGDGKPDICTVNFYSDNMNILQNLSTIGTVSFSNVLSFNFSAQSHPSDISIADMDGDGKQDLCIANYEADNVGFYRNTSIAGYFSFEGMTSFIQQYGTTIARAVDLNGDGRPDIINSRPTFNTSNISRNNCLPGLFSFDERVAFNGSAPGADIQAHDMNGDGKPDILMTGGGGQVRVFENRITQSVTGCSNGTSTIPANLSGSSYKWQQNTGISFANISNDANFSGTNTANLQIINPPISWNGYKYRCVVDADTSNVFLNAVYDNIVPTVSISNAPALFCTGDTTVFTATSVHGGTNPVYQWQDSSSIAGWQDIPGATYGVMKYATNIAGAKVRCKMTSSYTCANPAMLTSNTIKIIFTCNTSTSICANGNTQLTSNLTGGFYFWEADTSGGNIIGLTNGANYSGVNTATLQLTNIPSSFYGYRYFCYVDGHYSNSFTLKFTNTWTGAVSSAWENPMNWSCLSVPDANTDVIINSGTILISSNATIRSLTSTTAATITVHSGFNLLVLH